MTNKEIIQRLEEIDKEIVFWKEICLKYPQCQNYKDTVKILQQEKADLAEKLYKEKT
jgi:hypothetical protein